MFSSFQSPLISVLSISLLSSSVCHGSMRDDDDRFPKSTSSSSSSSSSSNPFEAQKNKFPAIFTAVKAGDLGAIKSQIDAGTPVDAFDADMYTPLMRAAFNGQEDVVKLLLEKGANPTLFRGGLPTDPVKGHGMKAIHSAVNGASLTTLKLVVDTLRKRNKSQEIALKDGDGQTVFDKANIVLEDLRRKILDKSNYLNTNAKLIADKQSHIDNARSFLAKGTNVAANQKKINDLSDQIADLTQKKTDPQRELDVLKTREAKMTGVYDYLSNLPEFKGRTPTSFSR